MTPTVQRIDYTNRNGKASHRYEADGRAVPGVTTILDVLNKPALPRWAAKSAAEYAINEWDYLSEQPVSERLALIKGSPWEQTKKAMARGTDVHAFAEQLVAGKPVDVPPELLPYVEPMAQWMDDYRVEPLLLERVVYNDDPEWCGTLDLLALIGGERLVIDYKTGKRAYNEVSLQLTAYRRARFLVNDDGTTEPMPNTDGAAVLQIDGQGGYQFRRVNTDAELYWQMCSLCEVYTWTQRADLILGTVPPPQLPGQQELV